LALPNGYYNKGGYTKLLIVSKTVKQHYTQTIFVLINGGHRNSLGVSENVKECDV
jgi:hypothetical protein